MSKVIEEMRNQTLKEAMLDVAKRMLADDVLSCEKIAEINAAFSVDYYKE